jgi:hypothetical protein
MSDAVIVARTGIPHFADMPTLQDISLTSIMERGNLAPHHIEALCARSYVSLSVHSWQMDSVTAKMLANARINCLSLNFYGLNNDTISGTAMNASCDGDSKWAGLSTVSSIHLLPHRRRSATCAAG